jgi:peptide deformylase
LGLLLVFRDVLCMKGVYCMAVKKILTIDQHDKFLRTPSQPVKKINREIKQLIEDIRDTIDANPAVGLAAPQIGVHKRVFGARMSYREDQPDEEMQPPIIFINPEILERSEETERGYDACLSIPGMMAYTTRNLKIKVRYQNEKGKRIEQEFEGWDARVIQHEIDHLDGILFLDRLDSQEDLYVLIPDQDGKLEPIPYLKVKEIAQSADKTRSPILAAGNGSRPLAEAKKLSGSIPRRF